MSALRWWITFRVLAGWHVLLRKKDHLLMCAALVLLLLMTVDHAFAYSPESFTGTRFGKACAGVMKYQNGTKNGASGEGLAALLTAVAGISAIISAAIGGFRMAWSLVVVALGSFILGDFIDKFLPYCK